MNPWVNQASATEDLTAGSPAAALASNKVLRNTYLLLAMTLAFSALTAAAAMAMNLPHPGLIVTLVGYFGLLFLTAKFRDRALGHAGAVAGGFRHVRAADVRPHPL